MYIASTGRFQNSKFYSTASIVNKKKICDLDYLFTCRFILLIVTSPRKKLQLLENYRCHFSLRILTQNSQFFSSWFVSIVKLFLHSIVKTKSITTRLRRHYNSTNVFLLIIICFLQYMFSLWIPLVKTLSNPICCFIYNTSKPLYIVVLLREILMTVLVSYFLLNDQCPFFKQGYGSTQTPKKNMVKFLCR